MTDKNRSDIFLSKEDKEKIKMVISQAESKTSGEIRVHILKKGKIQNIMGEAQKIFKILKMHKTEERNGILILIAPIAKKFAILGDAGINAKIDANFWNEIRDGIKSSFEKSLYLAGIENAVMNVGKILSRYFPVKPDDINELPDDVTES